MRLVRKAKGLNQIPNYNFWRDFGALQAVSTLSVICMLYFLSSYFFKQLLTLLVGRQEGHLACKKYGGMVEVGTG